MSWNSANLTLSQNSAFNSSDIHLPIGRVLEWFSIFMVLSFGGAIGNLLIVVLIASNKKLRTGCGLLIAHCLASYSLLCFISFPIMGITIYEKEVNYKSDHPKSCNIIMWIMMTCRYAGNWLDSYIAANRVVALCLPHRYNAFAEKTKEIVAVTILWCFAGLLSGLGVFGVGSVYGPTPLGNCTIYPNGRLGFLVLLLGLYGPSTFTAIAYVVIYVKMVVRKATSVSDERQGTIKRIERKRVITANTLCVSFLWSTICFLVMPIVVTITPLIDDRQVLFPLTVLWLTTLPMLGYSTNPIIFILMKEDYRGELLRLFGKKNIRLTTRTGSGTDSRTDRSRSNHATNQTLED